MSTELMADIISMLVLESIYSAVSSTKMHFFVVNSCVDRPNCEKLWSKNMVEDRSEGPGKNKKIKK